MKNLKRVLSIVMMLAMLVPLMAVAAVADEPVDLSANWYTLGGKFSSSTDKIIAPKSTDYKVKDVGFEFNVNEAGGVDVVVPNQEIFSGVYPIAALSSKNTTPLANLSVVMTPAEETVFSLDAVLADTRFCLLWTDTEIPVLADVQNVDRPGLEFGNAATSNGFRHLAATPTKGLSIVVSNLSPKNKGTKIATYVYVVLHDGVFVDLADNRPGYRWSFIARNHPDTPNGDGSGISRGYESIDIENGLEIAVREDAALGYVVIINDKEYYKGEEVGGFPNDTGGFEQSDYGVTDMGEPLPEGPSEKYLTSMTYARKDIDLSALKEVEEGYLVVGAVGNTMFDPKMNFTIDTINNVPASIWNGHANAWDEVVVEPTCTEDGSYTLTCNDGCADGPVVIEGVIPALGHQPGEEKQNEVAAGYYTPGSYETVCTVCGEVAVIETGRLENPFHDVNDGQWYTDGILFCFEKGYMEGTGNDEATGKVIFNRKGLVDRQQFATILAAVADADTSEYTEMSFSDVKAGQWYSEAIEWAYQNGYAAGTGAEADGTPIFGRKANVTRETLAVFFNTYANLNGIDVSAEADLSAYEDLDRVHSWALDAVEWAVAEGLISGTTETTLAPRGNASRAEIAIIIKSFAENVLADAPVEHTHELTHVTQ